MLICEEERQELISELYTAQRAMYREWFVHEDEWERWWQNQGADIVVGLHDLVFGREPEDGKTYRLRHARLGTAVVEVLSVDTTWINVRVKSGLLKGKGIGAWHRYGPGDERRVRRCFCHWTELPEKGP